MFRYADTLKFTTYFFQIWSDSFMQSDEIVMGSILKLDMSTVRVELDHLWGCEDIMWKQKWPLGVEHLSGKPAKTVVPFCEISNSKKTLEKCLGESDVRMLRNVGEAEGGGGGGGAPADDGGQDQVVIIIVTIIVINITRPKPPCGRQGLAG